jgi:hypothetical protein
MHTPQITVTTAHIDFSVFTSRCLVAASNGGGAPFSGFPNCPRPQLPVSHFSQLKLSIKVNVTLRLAIYRQSVRLGTKPLCMYRTYEYNMLLTIPPCVPYTSPLSVQALQSGTYLKVKVKVKVKVMLRPTVQSASLSWNKAPIWGLRPDLYYCQTVAGLLMWGALSKSKSKVHCDSQGHGGGIRSRLHTGQGRSLKDKVTLRLAVCQSVSLSVEPHLGLMTRYLLLFDSYGLDLWGALSNERTGLSFLYAACPRQRSLSRVGVPWDSWPSFTVSDLRLPFSSPPTTRRVTVEVFAPASTRAMVTSAILRISYYSPSTDSTENVSSIITCSPAAEETCPQSCSLVAAVVLSPVYIAVIWQRIYMSQYLNMV